MEDLIELKNYTAEFGRTLLSEEQRKCSKYLSRYYSLNSIHLILFTKQNGKEDLIGALKSGNERALRLKFKMHSNSGSSEIAKFQGPHLSVYTSSECHRG